LAGSCAEPAWKAMNVKKKRAIFFIV